jgi:hypothetical protein
MTMQKVQTFLREDQKTALRRIAARTGQKQSDLIRKGVDLVIDRAQNEKADWRVATDSAAGIWKDRTDIDDLIREMRDRVRKRFKHIYERK